MAISIRGCFNQVGFLLVAALTSVSGARQGLSALLIALALGACANAPDETSGQEQRNQAGVSTPGFVQQSYATPQSSLSTVRVTFSGAQTAGNLNVVAVGWNDTQAQVSSVSDARGNVYARAVGPVALAGTLSQ